LWSGSADDFERPDSLTLEDFYRRYRSACRELHADALPLQQLLALLHALAERAGATLH
jgi:hypothetical protein